MTSQHTSDALQPLLADLLDALSRSHSFRLVARPGWVMAHRVDGDSQTLDVPWTEAQHQEVCARLSQSVTLASGAVVLSLGDALMLQMPPHTLWKAEDIAREGWLSPLCARLLSASLAVGRNILVTGPWAAAVQLMATIVGEGQRPCVLGPAHDAVPRRWVRVSDVAAAQCYGTDRLAIWSAPAAVVAQAMGQLSGVMGWIDGRRLDRALIRYEVGADAVAGGGNAPLHVLAGLDLVVVVTDYGAPRVREVAEITLVESGYRPTLLFTTGVAPVTTALMPLGAPSFVEELAQAGHGVLAEELRNLQPSRPGSPVERAPKVQLGAPPPLAVSKPPPPAPLPLAVPTVEGRQDFELSPPGWEVDRITPGSADLAVGGSAEDATMAATYGLAPPPRPGSISKAIPIPTFAGAMQEARGPETPEGDDHGVIVEED